MTEEFLIEWLGREDFSLYGECCGITLDSLVAKGLAQIGPAPSGKGKEYAPVSLTDVGRAQVAKGETR